MKPPLQFQSLRRLPWSLIFATYRRPIKLRRNRARESRGGRA